MATRIVTLKGQAKWAKIFEANRDMHGYQGAYEDCDGAYVMNLYLTKDEYEKLRAAKSATKLLLDEETAERYIKLKRKHKGPFEAVSGAPKVEGWDYDSQGGLPNGSEVEVVVSVYDTKMTPGTRLDKVKVLKAAEMPKREEDEGMPF